MDKRMETVKQVWNFSLRSVWSRYYRQLQFLNRHRHIRTFIYMYPYTSTYRCRELHSSGPQQPWPTKVKKRKGKHHILGLIEAGLSCSCLEQLGWFAGRDPKDCAMGYVTENPSVPSTLGLGGWWRSERSKFLPLDGRRWGCLNLWLLSYWGLNLLGKRKKNGKCSQKKGKEKQINR